MQGGQKNSLSLAVFSLLYGSLSNISDNSIGSTHEQSFDGSWCAVFIQVLHSRKHNYLLLCDELKLVQFNLEFWHCSGEASHQDPF